MPHRRASHADAATTAPFISEQPAVGPDPYRVHARWADDTRTNFRIPAKDCAPSAARRYTRVWLEEIQGIDDDEACESVLLIVSELVTNAVVHTDSAWITCYLWTAADLLHIEVQDQGGRLSGPRVQSAADDDEHGRGLLLVQALARDWGIVPDPREGRSVWAAVPFISGTPHTA